MSTKSTMTIGRKAVYVAGDTIKIGSRGKPATIGQYLASMTKSEARKVRKGLRKNGFAKLAGARRAA